MTEFLNAAEVVLGPSRSGGWGDAPALVAGERRVSYAELDRAVNRAGNALRSLGVGRGERVLFLMNDTPEFAAAYLGALRIGAVAVALNTRTSRPALAHAISDSGAKLIMIERALLSFLTPDLRRGIAIAVAGGSAEGASSWDAAEAAARDALEPAETRADEPAFWIYSSGTTGQSKAIVHAHKDALPTGRVLTDVLGLGRGARVFSTSKLFFAYALDNAFLGALRAGATVVLHPGWPDPSTMLDVVERGRPDVVFSVPSFYRRIFAERPERLETLRTVRHFMSGGEAVPDSLDARWRTAIGRPILQLYGTSETFCVTIAMRPQDARTGSVGRPMPGVRLRLLDDAGAEVLEGTPGVLWVDHPALAQGYWRQPDLDAQFFRDGWFNTRDRFVRDAEGFWYHQGRVDEMLKISGQWVAPAEIEAVLLSTPGVSDAACVPVPDADGFLRLAAFVVSAGDPSTVESSVRAACGAHLPRHKWPRWVHRVDALPRTATGKLQRFLLRERLLAERKSGKP